MKTLNLKEVKLFTDAMRNNYVVMDVSQSICNHLYMNVPNSDITRSILERIQEGNGIIEITDTEEKTLIDSFKYGMFPVLCDGILIALNEEKLKEKIGDVSNISDSDVKLKTIQAMRELLKELKV